MTNLEATFDLLDFDDIDPKKEYDCSECNGLGTQRVEDLHPDTGRYTDYDVHCECCEGTGKIKGEVLQDKLA